MLKEQSIVLGKRGINTVYGQRLNMYDTSSTKINLGPPPKRNPRSKDSSNAPFLANRLLLRPSDYRNKNKYLKELLEGDLLIRENQIYDEDNSEYESILPLNCLYDYCLDKTKLALEVIGECRNVVNGWVGRLDDDNAFITNHCYTDASKNVVLQEDIFPFDLGYLRQKFEERPSTSAMKDKKLMKRNILRQELGDARENIHPDMRAFIDNSKDLLFYLDYDCISKLWCPDGINIGQGDDFRIDELTNEEYGPLEITSSCILGDRLVTNTIDLIKLKKLHKIFFTFKQFQGTPKGFGELVKTSIYDKLPTFIRPMIPTLIYGNTEDEAIHTLAKKDEDFSYPKIKYLSYNATTDLFTVKEEIISYDLLKYIGTVRDVKNNSSLKLEAIRLHQKGREPKNLEEKTYAEKLRRSRQNFLCFLNIMK
jgi:hypothetical protein